MQINTSLHFSWFIWARVLSISMRVHCRDVCLRMNRRLVKVFHIKTKTTHIKLCKCLLLPFEFVNFHQKWWLCCCLQSWEREKRKKRADCILWLYGCCWLLFSATQKNSNSNLTPKHFTKVKMKMWSWFMVFCACDCNRLNEYRRW